VLFPFIVRSLENEPWGEPGLCDLTTAYGFGGPFAWGVTEEEGRRFWRAFEAWGAARGVVSVFARLSVFAEDLLPFEGEVEERGPCVVRRLDLSEEGLWEDYASKVRTKVRKAESYGLEFEADPEGGRLDEFLEVYTATMDRRKAAPRYYFPRSFYESLRRDLRGHFFFVHALLGGRVVATDLELYSGERAYGLLTGTLVDAMPLGATDFLRHHTFLYARRLGIRAVVLGGGYQPNDGILRYKRTLAPGCEKPYRLARRTLDPEGCARLTERRRRWEAERGRSWEPVPGFFPPYRS
jgi:hypothetical protein